MAHPPLLAGQIPCTTLHAALGDLQLESGAVIQDFQQAYVLHGRLNAKRSNVILVCAALTATHHRLDFLIGPGKALDTERWCVIAMDPIANGISTSPSNSARQPGMRFPRFVLRDMVQAQHRLLREHLGINHLHAVVGASMGGMQALQWAVSHPGFMGRIVGLTPMARTHPWAVMVTEAARSCLMADPAWTGSGFSARPERGWRAYAALMNALAMKTPRALAAKLPDRHAAHAWFEDLLAGLHRIGFDAHDYLYQSWAYEAHDVGTTPGHSSTEQALSSIRAATLLLAPPLDLFNPPEAARDAAACIPGARFVEIPSIEGHLAASATDPRDALFLNDCIRSFLVD
jgi:homoserine O-acetyltransferase